MLPRVLTCRLSRLAHLLRQRRTAGMLPVVLFISLVITMLCGALIGAAHYKNRLLVRDRTQVTLSRNAHSAFTFLLADTTLAYEQPTQLDLYGDGTDSVSLLKRRWGLFDLALVRAHRGQHAATRCGLLGATPDPVAHLALWLGAGNRPLLAAGNSILRGPCRLPAGIRQETIEGKSFTGQVPQSAALPRRQDDGPPPPAALLTRMRWLQGLPGDLPLRPISELTDVRERSFREAPLVFFSPGDLMVATPLRGQVLVCSRGTLTVAATAQLTNVVLVARKIVVQAGFTGCLQLIARDTILIETQCQLQYPSVAAVSGGGPGHVSIGAGSELAGLVVVGDEPGNVATSTLLVAEGARVTGQVYTSGLASVRGSVHGSVACQQVYTLTPAAYYENLLLDAEIDLGKRPEAFLSSPLLAHHTPLAVLQWLE